MLIPDWRQVLKKSWSIRLILLAGVLSGLEAVLPLFQTFFPRGMFAILTILLTVSAVIARLIAQPRMHGDDDGGEK